MLYEVITVDGWFQADVECNPLLGPQVYDMALKLMNGQTIDREVLTNETVYYPDTAAELLPSVIIQLYKFGLSILIILIILIT